VFAFQLGGLPGVFSFSFSHVSVVHVRLKIVMFSLAAPLIVGFAISSVHNVACPVSESPMCRNKEDKRFVF